ncbi:M10 family metallopeptidase C-terminal domain-containing protein [Seohaeicola saemankumensis]|nr:M10 family metallopeptidase C-terminal domain-containing protein [Seohaeicola saemankumensis]MCA0869706.1 M10 family metallopeptidase C-terminal domain-containing protein [Seohaeicola saemankumensis]
MVIERAGGGRDTVKSATISLSLSDYANIENLRLFGTADLNLAGDGGANVLTGNAGANRLRGGAGQDRLKGFAGDDILIGGRGRDVMFGGSGSDVFVFAGAADSGTTQATRDWIGDFSQGEGDLLDLSALDASSAPGDQALRFLGTGAFTAREGELRFGVQGAHTIVEVDVDGDGGADFALMLRGQVALVAGDFIL